MGGKAHQTRLGRPNRPRPRQSKALDGSPRLTQLVLAGLLITNALTLVCFLMSPDIANLMGGGRNQVLRAYQDRIGQLRVEVDKLNSRQYARAGNLNIQLQDLAQEQEELSEQHQYIKALAEKASALGLGPIEAPPAPAVTAKAQPAALGHGGDLGEITPVTIAGASHRIRVMIDDSRTMLAAISARATASTNTILDQLREVGIDPKFATGADSDGEEATGGPLLPPKDNADEVGMVDQANTVVDALARYRDARQAIADAPIHLPIAGKERISSPFGNRTDPFTGRVAFHPGIDMPWPTGTTVRSAGAGKVSFVGQIRGYGNAIDIDNGGGITTRYGHLSGFITHVGAVVSAGTPIGRVGSTGRSTGPHLHFEIRLNNQPVNPDTYLGVGRKLAHFLQPAPDPVAET